jgi:hypothetical protein
MHGQFGHALLAADRVCGPARDQDRQVRRDFPDRGVRRNIEQPA